MDLLQLIGINVSSFTHNLIVANLISGAAEGVIIGLITGALVLSFSMAPDALGRALLLAVIFGLVGFIVEFARISTVMGFSMGQIIRALSDNPVIGPMVLNAFVRTGFYMLLGAVIGVGSRVPQYMVRGIVIGIFLGGLVGAVLLLVTRHYLGISLNIVLFRFLIVIGVWGLITAVSGK